MERVEPRQQSLIAAQYRGNGVEPGSRRPRMRSTSGAFSSFRVAMLIAFLALEYVRDPRLQSLRLQTLFLIVLPLAWLASRDRPWSRNLSLQVAFIIVGALALPFAHNYFAVYENTRLMYGFLVTAIATTWLLDRGRAFKRVLWVWVGIMCFQALWALTHDGHGYGSFLEDENDLALACDMALPFAMLGALYLSGAKRWISGVAAGVLLLGIVASFSRGGFLGLVAAVGYCVLAGRHRVRNIAIGCALAGVLYLAVPFDYKAEMSTIDNTSEGTAETRLFLWIAATRMWMDHPIFGVGPQNAALLVGRYQPEPTEGGMFSSPAFQDRDWGMTALHSVYFQLLSERGLVGVVLFGWMLFSFYASLRRLRRNASRARARAPQLIRDASLYALGLEAAMAGFLVAGAFLSMLYYPYFWFFTALAVAHERAIRREWIRGDRRLTQAT